MSRKWICLAAALVSACAGGSGPTAREPRGLITVDRDGEGRVFEVPARSFVCARDTTAAVSGVGTSWAGAVSVRTLLPLSEARDFTIRNSINTVGSAMVALRALGDSALAAWVATSGTVHLEAGDSVAGTFAVTVERDSTTARFTGRFSTPAQHDACP